jgi:hypothetical protein
MYVQLCILEGNGSTFMMFASDAGQWQYTFARDRTSGSSGRLGTDRQAARGKPSVNPAA